MDPALIEIVEGDPVKHLQHDDPAVRRIAVAACRGLRDASALLIELVANDPDPAVRAEAVGVLPRFGDMAVAAILGATGDESPDVVEAAATALGELADEGMPWLLQAARAHPDALVQEAAVASLGAIGNAEALPLLLELARSGKPQIRRRSLVALTAYDGQEVEAAFESALADRNPMVREVAETVRGRRT